MERRRRTYVFMNVVPWRASAEERRLPTRESKPRSLGPISSAAGRHANESSQSQGSQWCDQVAGWDVHKVSASSCVQV